MKQKYFLPLLLFIAISILYPSFSQALTFPTTTCDYLNAVSEYHLSPLAVRENGTIAFKYGADNNSFVTVSGDIASFHIQTFLPVDSQSPLVRFAGFSASCGRGYGTTFDNVILQGENLLDFNRANYQFRFNGGEWTQLIPAAGGMPIYFYIEVYDDWQNPTHASYSYLVDINNPQNPSGGTGEPSGKRPVLIVPGILGTEIRKGQELLWADVIRMAHTNNDRFMDPLSFNNSSTPSDLGLELSGVITQKSILGFNYVYTTGLIDTFSSSGYTEETNLFTFPYDWRKDMADIAVNELKDEIDNRLAQTRFQKLDIIAHSQGGLVVKKLLLDHPEYQNKINKLVFVGVPNLGAPKAARALLYGDSMGVEFLGLGLDPAEIKRIGLNMPAVYELLPSADYFLKYPAGYLGIPQPSEENLNNFKLLDFNETQQQLKDRGLNVSLIERGRSFHATGLDGLDFSGSPIQVYNVVGCQAGTIGYVIQKAGGKYKLDYVAGDGTVPADSANQIPGAATFYALDSSHGAMLSQNGIRQLLVNIIAGAGLSTEGKITPSASDCRFSGRQVWAQSPVELHIYDESNNHVGPNPDGSFDAQIAGVQYDTVEDEKFAFLPPGHDYTVKLVATAAGNFDFFSSMIENGQTISTAYYGNVPISSASRAEIELVADNTQSISLDSDGDGLTDQALTPSAVLDAFQSQDFIAPTTTAAFLGTQGQTGWYRSDVSLTLHTGDPIIAGREAETAGVLATYYSLDNQATTTYSGRLDILTEGLHSLDFFSLDRAGNAEALKTVVFTFDKTPPELSIRYELESDQFTFTATDNLDPNPSIICSNGHCTASDQAGNQTEITFDLIDKKINNRLSVKSIAYNHGTPITPVQNTFHVQFREKREQLRDFDQFIKIKQDERARINYQKKKNQSVITHKLKGEKRTREIYSGFKHLELITNQGSLEINIK